MKRCLILTMVLLVTGITMSLAKPAPDKDRSARKANTESSVMETESWEFYSTVTSPTTEELSSENNFYFGGAAGCLYNTFLKLYVAKEEVVPGDPRQRNIIRKPTIYKTVRFIEKQLKKDIKADKIDKDQATIRFEEVLKKAISAFDSETESFEKALTNCDRKLSNLYAVFDKVKLIEI